MFHHFSQWSEPCATGDFTRYYVSLGKGGWIGVDLFFVLSGFLITGILLDSRNSCRYFRSFYIRRSLRVWPLYYGVLIAVFIIGPTLGLNGLRGMKELNAEQGWLWAYGTNLIPFFRNNWIPCAEWLNMWHFWSLAVEEQFYLVWPFLVYFLGRRPLAAVCLVGILVTAPIRYAMLRFGVSALAIYALYPCRMDSLLVGSLLAILVRRSGGPRALLKPALISTGLALLVIGATSWHDRAWLYLFGWRMQQMGYTALAIAFGGLLILALNARPGGTWHAVWTFAPLRMLGRYSYGLYIYHNLFGKLIEQKLRPLYAGPTQTASLLSQMAFMAATFAVFLVVAVASYHIIEMPFLRLKRYFPP